MVEQVYARLCLRIFAIIVFSAIGADPQVNASGAISATTGTQAVTLKWTSPTSGPSVSKYRVYRAEGHKNRHYTKCERYDRISEIQAPTTSYEDANVKAGRTYCYTVKSVIGDNESKDGPIVVVTLPK